MGLKSIKKRGGTKVSVKPKKFNSSKVRSHLPAIQKNWDGSKTLKENYKHMGLAFNPNVSVRDSNETIDLGPTESAPLREPRLSHGELLYLDKLAAKHGEDYKAMQRDIKLNYYQFTKKNLKKKFLLYKQKYANGAGAEGAEAEMEGEKQSEKNQVEVKQEKEEEENVEAVGEAEAEEEMKEEVLTETTQKPKKKKTIKKKGNNKKK
eukprot:TRINITY_DN3009_c0_g2_i2.p1 TRINITY_DN3009_c0_g2~~TRINITY_DN3009_c0_g2_i2.p1  ORF type:complete len:207 (-),score=72.34 TRINITY_DN3009_c0_g2_i2:28-648(-)